MVYEGCTLVVWNTPADPEVLIEHARLCGATGVDIKVHDGDSIWTDRRFVTREYFDAVRRTGLKVYGWGYNYLDNLPAEQHPGGGGSPELEAAAAVGAIDRYRPDAYSSDVEEYADKGDPSNTSRFFQFVKEGYTGTLGGDTTLRGFNVPALGAFTWADWRQHVNNALLILDAVQVARPMCYGKDNPLSLFYDAWGKILAGKSVAPVFSITDANEDQYLADQVAEAKQRGCIGYGIWEHSAVSSRPGAVQAMARAWHGVAQPTPANPSHVIDVEDTRKIIFDAAGDLYNLGAQTEASIIQNAIRLAKGETH